MNLTRRKKSCREWKKHSMVNVNYNGAVECSGDLCFWIAVALSLHKTRKNRSGARFMISFVKSRG
jgi:hypothetical protein